MKRELIYLGLGATVVVSLFLLNGLGFGTAKQKGHLTVIFKENFLAFFL